MKTLDRPEFGVFLDAGWCDDHGMTRLLLGALGAALGLHASELSQNLFPALLVHQIVVFPYGLMRARLERAVVAAAYALAVLGYPPSEASNDANTVLSAVAIGLVPL